MESTQYKRLLDKSEKMEGRRGQNQIGQKKEGEREVIPREKA